MAGKNNQFEWDASKSAAVNARRVLPRLVAEYFAAGRKLMDAQAAPEDLHRFRLRTKRFRYTLELFRQSYGPSLDQRLKAVREVQVHLGNMNDCTTTRSLLDGVLSNKVRQEVQDFLDKSESDNIVAFRKYWQEVFDAPNQEKKWTDYLTRFAGRRGPTRKRAAKKKK